MLSSILRNNVKASRALFTQATAMRFHGNLSDQDRIFTNVYKDEDPFIAGALKRGDWH